MKYITENAHLILSGLVATLTLIVAGCQPTAEFMGEEVTARELEWKYNEAVSQKNAEIESINAQAEAASAEIQAEELALSEGVRILTELAAPLPYGNIIASGLGIAGILGFGGQTLKTRRKAATAFKAIDEAKEGDTVNFKNVSMPRSTERFVDNLRGK